MIFPLLVGSVQASDVSEFVGDVAKRVFTETERNLIRNYYHQHDIEIDDDDDGYKSKKGKGKKDKGAKGKGNKKLPPGIAKKLARGGTLPPGIAKRNLPYDLEARLPPLGRGFERQVIDGKVVLVETATAIVHDIIEDLLD
ncbi:hypothetical protein BOW53_14440 [Solemya pervernicosa gill symbiont]|uniref:Uncharacterized protein n=2 Tax=Gammaproteobacteria incertae sedis TaxID=118884 RepID=A0A1T2L0U7_9GAMM|nr:hypothetical protein BOW53_14440 [Solemya pervernicosa gill symbiont]